MHTTLTTLALTAFLALHHSNAMADAIPVVVSVGVNRSFDGSLGALSFAETDAERFTHVMTSVGGVEASNATLLRSPTAEEFVDAIKLQSRRHPHNARLIVYFSGHADDRGMHFRSGPLARAKLHELLAEAKASTKIIFIDSCFSGSIATKGVEQAAPFDLPKLDLDELTGSVFLTASSARDVAYESKELSGSVFTHNVIAGLNGAADANTDSLVTIDELYQYVYRETRLRSITYPGSAPQRPEYHAELHGQGAIILSQPRQGLGTLRIDPGIIGTVHLASMSGLGNFTVYGQPMSKQEFRLPEGSYRAMIRRGDKIGEASVLIARQEIAELRPQQFAWHSMNYMTPEATKGGPTNAAVMMGMVSVRRAFGETYLESYHAEVGRELIGTARAQTRVSIFGGGGLYSSVGLLEQSPLSAHGLSLSVGLIASRSTDAIRLTIGATQSREWQEWAHDYFRESISSRIAMIPSAYVGAFLPISQGYSLGVRREVTWTRGPTGDPHKIDQYTLGLAIEP